ncbi:Polysialic acid transport protein KpsD [Halomonadaceae bacterium LMG 33818]|uniref:polysaccharide biosynthesis/export family protein n=1 Tax=Cernens ardua TaxID=3402176 RepID=UPI003EDBFBB2
MFQRNFLFRAGCLVAVACLSVSQAYAQEVGNYADSSAFTNSVNSQTSDNDNSSGANMGASSSVAPNSTSNQVNDTPQANWNSSHYGSFSNLQEAANGIVGIRPFGASLFDHPLQSAGAQGLTPGYRIKPGDQINLRVWGGVQFNQTLTVDSQGNVFLPGIGPLNIQGTSASGLNGAITSAIKRVYPQNVDVYTNLQTVQPVGVFVTGNVNSPGRYSGTPDDSLLYFLDQAGGIDQTLGSFRHIEVKRNGRTIAHIDLYNFLINGNLPNIQFRNGDTIVVEDRGPTVTVTGDVGRSFMYELSGHERLDGRMVTQLARLNPGVTNVLLRGDRSSGPIASYMNLNQFGNARIESGDEVLFSQDQRSDVIVVQLRGSYYGPTRYALPRDAHLGELLNAISVPKDMTDYQDVSIYRKSVAREQEQALQDSLNRLEQTYMGYPSRTPGEAQIQLQQSQLIERFVQRARQVKPSGRLVVAREGDIADIRLQDGDVVDIPENNDSVLLSGEITIPQAMVYTKGLTAKDYIQDAGGYTPRANHNAILVVHANGEVVSADQTTIRSGDQIMVLPKPPTSNIELATSISQVMYQIAVAVLAVTSI